MSRSPATPFAPLTVRYACIAEGKIAASRPGAALAIAAAVLSGTLVVSTRTATAKAPAPASTALVEGTMNVDASAGLAAMPFDRLLAVVAPAATSLPAGTLLAVVRAAVSRLPLASVLGILGPLVGSSGAPVPGVGRGAATRPSMTTTTRPATTTTTAPFVAAAPARALASSPVSPRCATARDDVEAAGLVLPAQFEYRCPGSTGLFAGDRQHWGTTCSMASLCPESSYIAINPAVIGPSDARLRHVVAHETCHALDVAARRPLTEAGADACAASYGFRRV